MFILQAIFWFLFTIVIYVVLNRIYQIMPYPFLIPILTGTALLVIILSTMNISYDTYFSGGRVIDAFLGPAIVALAYPLYKQRELLKRYKKELLSTVLYASLLGILSGYWLTMLFGFEEVITSSFVPKNVTTPVAMEVARMIGGEPALAVIFVMIAGIGGAVTGPWVLKQFNISNFLGIGMALGAASHAIGTAKALEYGQEEAAVSSIGMSLCALCVSIIAPILINWL
ncbi:LrgB family protein [Alkalihalobacillus sp. R86527]|uniref:LrgB family protein n=1 Tax=Alkalihalobacillus sp. R86527 TaxID=3093863 RepID=UPI00366CEE92